MHLTFGDLAVGVEDLGFGVREDGDVAFLEEHHARGERRHRDRVGAQVHFTVADADRERAAFARPDQHVVLAGEQDGDAERAFEPAHGGDRGLLG